MRRLLALIVYTALSWPLFAAANFGVDTVSSEWFREWYQWGDLRHYLDNACDVTVYQGETTGGWSSPEALKVSVNGNSYRWNRYYIDGFRVDSRIHAGGAYYTPDMFAHSMRVDYNRGAFFWQTDSVRDMHIRLTGQAGNIGGYSPSARWLLEHIEGRSAIQRLYKQATRTTRRHMVGAGSIDAVYAFPAKGRTYTQHVSAEYGVRRQLKYDYDGIYGTYDAGYGHVQLDGQLPVAPNSAFDALHYIFRAGSREDGNSEYGYNINEVARQIEGSFSIYGTKAYGSRGSLTTGLTYGLQHDRHRQLDFTRNILDVDGEAFEPWYPDGHTHELNWAVNYRYRIEPWLQLQVEGYNTFLAFSPSQRTWTNRVELQGYNMSDPIALYDYHWSSHAFCAGMLENTAALVADYPVLPWLRLHGEVAVTLDGMLLRDQSVVTPSWEAKAALHIEPVKWFRMDIIAANYRIPYTYEQVQFLSKDYLNGQVYYAGTNTLLTTTGGQYHRMRKGLMQPQYVVMDIPIVFTIGRHEISILSSFKKYYHTWSVRLAPESADSYEATSQDYDIYRMKPQERYYEVGAAPKTGSGIFNSPMFVSNVIKYTYNGRKVYVSFSWQSECVSGVPATGNGMQTEDIQVLSESFANPNSTLVHANMQQNNPRVRMLGRLHQDRAYVARLQLGVNITENWQLSLSGKFRDGIPFAHYRTYLDTDAAGQSQAIVWAANTRGINVKDSNFGARTDSFFNFDLRLKYRGAIKGVPFEIQAVCYNVWDFATELNEYCMYYDGATGQDRSGHRYPLSLCTPRGLLLTMQVGLTRNK